MNSLHDAVGCWVIGGRSDVVRASQLTQLVEEAVLKLPSLICGDPLRSAKPRYPIDVKFSGNGECLLVL